MTEPEDIESSKKLQRKLLVTIGYAILVIAAFAVYVQIGYHRFYGHTMPEFMKKLDEFAKDSANASGS